MADPISEHRAFIDDLIARNPSTAARLVREKAAYSPAEGNERFNELVHRLSTEDRELFAEMLQEERTASHFDALIWLNDACITGGLRLIKDGVEIPPEPFGYTMFEEYLTVLQDGDWSQFQGS